MTPATLQALRRLLFFSVEEAAAQIGGVSARSWQYWERAERTIPADVAATIDRLIDWRAAAIEAATATLRDMSDVPAALVWYASIDAWLTLPDHEPILWRPHQSVVAALCAKRIAKPITFDVPAYRAWLGDRVDDESMRGAWAASNRFLINSS